MKDLIRRLRDDARHNGHSSDWFVEHCIRVHKAADALERMQWQPIETAPLHEAVLVRGGDILYPTTASKYEVDPEEGGGWAWILDAQGGTWGDGDLYPAEWMPLPHGEEEK